MDYSVRNVRTFNGMEGPGFNATLLRDGKPVAELIDDGCGGCVLFRWKDRAEEKLLNDHIKTLPPYEFPMVAKGEKFHVTADLFVGRLIDFWKFEKGMRRRCDSAIVFRLTTDDKGTARRWLPGRSGMTYSAAITYLKEKYNGLIEIIYNEKYGCGCKAFSG